MYEYRCDERLKTKVEGSTRLVWLRWRLEHLFFFVSSESIKRELNIRLKYESWQLTRVDGEVKVHSR